MPAVVGGARSAMITHEYAEVNGVRLHYATAGEGPLILFLHGFPEFWYEWRHQLEEFGKDHQAVAPDMRGYNLSDKPAELEQYRMPHLVEDVRALAAHLLKRSGRETFTLVAHDWGGAVAWTFALSHPAMLDGLVAINIPHPAILQRELQNNPAQQQASQYMLMFRSPQAETNLSANNYAGLVNAVLGEGLTSGRLTDADRQAYLAAWSQPGALTGGLNYYRAAQIGPPGGTESPASGDFGVGQISPIVQVPTLVIWGEKDTALLTGNLNGVEAYVPDLTLKRVPEGSHWVINEYPGLVNGYIREFIARMR
jgi:pimeloyl-ACP methyl ester carboxylesterase